MFNKLISKLPRFVVEAPSPKKHLTLLLADLGLLVAVLYTLGVGGAIAYTLGELLVLAAVLRRAR